MTPLIQATIRRALRYGQPADWADAQQETFLKIFSKSGNWSGQGSVCGWVHQIAVRTAIDHSRRAKRAKKVIAPLASFEAVEDKNTAALPPSVEKCIEKTLDSMEGHLRQAYELRIKQGMTIEQTADALGKKPRSISLWMQTVRERLLACLD